MHSAAEGDARIADSPKGFSNPLYDATLSLPEGMGDVVELEAGRDSASPYDEIAVDDSSYMDVYDDL